jgi:nitroreductase
MDVFEAIRARASVRTLEPCRIAQPELEMILDAGRRAPSGYNRQPWEFIVVRDRETLQRLGRIQECIAEGSAAIAVVLDERPSEFWREDAGAAIENMLLAIVALGYASVWVEGYVLEQEAYGKSVLGVPKHLRLLAILPVGRAAASPLQAGKKPLAELVHYERYGARAESR